MSLELSGYEFVGPLAKNQEEILCHFYKQGALKCQTSKLLSPKNHPTSFR